MGTQLTPQPYAYTTLGCPAHSFLNPLRYPPLPVLSPPLPSLLPDHYVLRGGWDDLDAYMDHITSKTFHNLRE